MRLFYPLLFCLVSLVQASPEVGPTITASGPDFDIFARGVFVGDGALLTGHPNGTYILLFSTTGSDWHRLYFKDLRPSSYSALTTIGANVWLARNNGLCWLSWDDGLSWKQAESSPNVTFRSDPAALAQLGKLGVLRVSGDSRSLEFHASSPLPLDEFTCVSVVSPNTAVGAIRFPGKHGDDSFALVRTFDSGRDWQCLVKEGGFSFFETGNWFVHHMFFLTAQSGWISSDVFSDVYHTRNGGDSWVRIEAPDRVVSAIFFRNEMDGRIIGGSTARVYETHDGGLRWRELSDQEVLGYSFVEYFSGAPEYRWNDFGLYRVLLSHLSMR